MTERRFKSFGELQEWCAANKDARVDWGFIENFTRWNSVDDLMSVMSPDWFVSEDGKPLEVTIYEKEPFCEEYRKAWGWDDYDEGEFLASVLANSWAMGCVSWMDIKYDGNAKVRHHVSEIGVCLEDRIVASIMDGTCVFHADDPNDECGTIEYKPDFNKWCQMINNPNDEVESLLDEFMEGQDDADTSDALLQCWIYGEVIWG